MNVDEVLQSIEQTFLARRLDPVERFVLQQSWIGLTYEEMARNCAYGSDYVKEIGSQLWQDLSRAVGERVTKKNLHIVFNQLPPTPAASIVEPVSRDQAKVLAALEDRGIGVQTAIVDSKTEFPSGPVPLGSPFYIHRPPVEETAFSEIHQPGSVIRIKAPRKMGKTSLLNRMIAHAEECSFKTVYLNFQEADESVFASLDKFLRWFCANVGRQLNLPSRLNDYWDEDMGSKVSCKTYFEHYLLEQISSPLLLALDEVNRVFEHPEVAQDFLPMLRSWHEQAKQSDIWQKLRLVVAHATEIYIPLKLNQSPFNVGLLITLPQFTLEQVQELAQRYDLDWFGETGKQQAFALKALVGGHPYLVRAAFYHLAQGEITLDRLLQSAPTQAGIYSSHLRSHLVMLQEQPQLATALQQVVSSSESVQLDAIVAYKLESMGLVQFSGNQAQPSCELYRRFFQEQLAEINWSEPPLKLPKQERSNTLPINQFDPLTQLANRDYLNQYLESKWQKWVNTRTILSLIICDLDYFKYFNDAYGQQVGDACLQEIAIVIQDCLTPYATALPVRYSGAKFAILLPEVNAQTATTIAEAIRTQVRAQAFSHDQSRFGGFPASVLTASVGVANTVVTSAATTSLFVAAAEEALKQSIRRGHDCSTLSQPFDSHRSEYHFIHVGSC
jgi:diguanylate cyclase (GGDEF)-like protein